MFSKALLKLFFKSEQRFGSCDFFMSSIAFLAYHTEN